MRIALLTKRYPPQRCGVGDYAAQLAAALAARGHAVTVFVASHAELRPAALPVREIALASSADIAAALREIGSAQPDVVLIEYSSYAWDRWGIPFWMNRFVRELRRSGPHVAVALHEIAISARAYPRWAPLAFLQSVHAWRMAASAHTVIVNTRAREAMLRRWLFWRPESVHYRPNSSNIPVTEFSSAQRNDLRRARGDAPSLVVTMFGSFSAWKKYEDAIRAVAALRKTTDARLWLLGDWTVAEASYVRSLRELIAALQMDNHCWWAGPLSPEEISAHLGASDIFVLPQADGDLTRSGAFLAAAAHGLACIAVRNAENQTEFTHGENVWLVESSTAENLRAAMERLAAEPALREKLGRSLRALYAEKFAIERTVDGLPFLLAEAGAAVESLKVEGLKG